MKARAANRRTRAIIASFSVNPTALSIEVDPAGNIVSSVRFLASVYRSFRVADLYGLSAPAPRPAVTNVPFRAVQ
jgi:hypothetical protein